MKENPENLRKLADYVEAFNAMDQKASEVAVEQSESVIEWPARKDAAGIAPEPSDGPCEEGESSIEEAIYAT